MNPRAVDLYVRSFTTALIAVVVVFVAAYEGLHTGTVDGFAQGAATIIIGVYFGSHVSQNAAGARSRAEELAVERAAAQPRPADPLAPTPPPNGGNVG